MKPAEVAAGAEKAASMKVAMDKPTRPLDRLNEQCTVTSAVLVQEPGKPAELKEPGKPAELEEPGEPAELGEPEVLGRPEGPGEPRESAELKELQGMRRAREGGTVAKAGTVRVRREAERLAEDTKMDPSKVRGSDGQCASSGVRQSGDPGGGPEPEAKCKPACGKPLGVLDEIQTLDRATGAQKPGSAVMGAQEVPGGQMIVATVASVRDQIQETARLFDPHGSPLITLEGGENGSVQKDMQKQSAAQQVPAQLSSFQPGLRCGATCTERPKEPVSGKVSGTPTAKTQESITLEDRELSGDKEEAMHNSRRSERQDETAEGMRAMPSTNAARGRRRSGQVAEVAEALLPSPTDEDPPAARYGRLTTSGTSAGATAATSRDQAQGATGSGARYELQPSREKGSRGEPPLGGLWKGADETGQKEEHTRSCGAERSAPEPKAKSAAHPDVPPGTNPAAVATTQ